MRSTTMVSRYLLVFASSALLLGISGAQANAQQTLSYEDLVRRLTDLQQLAKLPEPGESCAQWSSYDRKSRFDSVSGKYIAWDANGDNNGMIRKEGDKFVMAEMQGPGCIWRIWSAAPKEGHVRIYLDGAAEPAVDLPFVGYFDRNNAPFTRSELVHTVSKGWNNYTPIPYQKSCKIVADPGWGAYYHFTYATFPRGTQVPTFKRELGQKELAALDEANRLLSRWDSGSISEVNGQKILKQDVNIRAGATAKVASVSGQRALTCLRVKFADGPIDRDLLRELALQIHWDGEAEPSVWAPLGDFFGTAPGANVYQSFPMGVGADGWWYCRWYMPFAKQARVSLVNSGKRSARLSFEMAHAPLSQPIASLGRFHAKWHRDAFLPAEPERAIDWPMLKTEGAGRFVGVMLHIWNPRGSWWGEGDEKFFVDGEKFPSTFGTGSEDYFGYAWCDPALFRNAFHNQTHNDGNNKGHVSVNRWHVADNIPFHKGIEASIEKYYANERPTLYAGVAYWYLAPGGNDPYRPAALEQRVGYCVPVQPIRAQGAIEGESLQVLSKTAGNPHEQDLTGFAPGRWSGDAHLWWIEAKPGDKLELALPVDKAGAYKLEMQLTKAPDYGIVQLYLDGQKLGEPLDLYNKSVVPTGVLGFGKHTLTAGAHKLSAEIVGANDQAIKSYMFGLDYVRLVPD